MGYSLFIGSAGKVIPKSIVSAFVILHSTPSWVVEGVYLPPFAILSDSLVWTFSPSFFLIFFALSVKINKLQISRIFELIVSGY